MTSLLSEFVSKKLEKLAENNQHFWNKKDLEEKRKAHEATFYRLLEVPAYMRVPEKFNSQETQAALEKTFKEFVEKVRKGELDWRALVPKRKWYGLKPEPPEH